MIESLREGSNLGKLFSSVSSLWVQFIPLLTVSKVGIVDLFDDCSKNSNDNDVDVLTIIKRLGELREFGLVQF